MRRSLAATLASAVVILGLPVALVVAPPALSGSAALDGTAHAAEAPYATTDLTVPVVDGPDDTNSVDIDARLYVPPTATAATPQPAMLITNGFGLSKDADEVTSLADFFARAGYVVLAYSGQGFGRSTGCISLDSADYDVKDARQLIDLLQARPEVLKDAKGAVVGIVGGSYGGGLQGPLAAHDPRIRAIAPGRTWSSLQYALYPNNRVLPGDPTGFAHQRQTVGVFKAQWTSLFFAVGTAQPATGQNPSCPESQNLGPLPGGISCGGYRLVLCDVYARIATTGTASDADRALLARSSTLTFLDRVRVPTLLVQGQSDTLFNLNDALAAYTGLRARGVPATLIWNSGGHGGYNSLPFEGEAYGGGTELAGSYLGERTMDFFDRYLRGRGSAGPGFAWYEGWRFDGKDARRAYDSAPAYPAMPSQTFTLSGADTLALTGATAGSATFANPPGGQPAAYSETSNFSAPGAQFGDVPPTEVPGTFAAFTSPPLARAVESVGVPRATLRLSHVAPTDLTLFGKVYDVAPDGTATLIHRLSSPIRVPTADLAQPVTFNLLGFAHRFDAGHRVRLVLAATDQTSYNNKVADTITVTTGPGSTFSLPVSAPITAAAPAGGTGAGGSGGTAGSDGSGTGGDGSAIGPDGASGGGVLADTGSAPLLPLAGIALLAGAAALRRRRTA